MATLNRFSAVTIVDALNRTLEKDKDFVIYTSGGGMHNPLLMEHIHSMLPGYTFHTTDALKINPDAKEALLFAILANECVAGGNTPIGNGSNDIPSVSMGKISFPSSFQSRLSRKKFWNWCKFQFNFEIFTKSFSKFPK
jgi:anhydro-N-acetylmuramic acid kinase